MEPGNIEKQEVAQPAPDMPVPSPEEEKPHWKRSFLIIASGQAVSLMGSSAVQFALIWWLASETNSAMMLSLAGLMAFLPQIVLGPFAGVWVDRLKRKTVIIAADLFIALGAGLFALLFLLGEAPYWSACIVLFLRGVGNVFHTPAIQAAMPMLVPGDQLMRVNSWSQFFQSGAFMLGPVIGAALYAVLPIPLIMLFDVGGAIVACTAVALVNIPDPPREKTEVPHMWREMKEGVNVFLADKRLCIITVSATLVMIFYMPLAMLYPLMTSDHIGGTAWHASIVEFVYAGGMMLCSVLVGLFGEVKHKFAMIYAGLIGLSATALLSGLLPPGLSMYWLFVVFCALMGASGNLYNIPYIAYAQQTIPPSRQGRAFSLIGTLLSLTMPVGLLIAGPIAEADGVTTWFVIAGIGSLLITVASMVAMGIYKANAAKHQEAPGGNQKSSNEEEQ